MRIIAVKIQGFFQSLVREHQEIVWGRIFSKTFNIISKRITVLNVL